MRVWRVHFHWLQTPNSSIDVVAENASMAIHKAVKIKLQSGSTMNDENVLKVEQIASTKEPEL